MLKIIANKSNYIIATTKCNRSHKILIDRKLSINILHVYVYILLKHAIRICHRDWIMSDIHMDL